jgi:hypothetical protein
MTLVTNRILIALVITAMTGVMAFAKQKKDTVTFPTDIQVGSTLVKKGTYNVKYDDQTHELQIVDGKNIIARASTTTEKRVRKSSGLQFAAMANGQTDSKKLVSITFGGSKENILLSQNGGPAEGSNQE